MVKWQIIYTKRSQEDALKLKKCGLKDKTQKLLNLIAENPFITPPFFEKLSGLSNTYSRRINIRHRLVYEVLKEEGVIVVRMMYKHYDD